MNKNKKHQPLNTDKITANINKVLSGRAFNSKACQEEKIGMFDRKAAH